ncbi:hypothetical protein BGZ51_009420 [Haplosporangium sp. Z 767]|nr:hypothetical protein BGZ51_009420 [Haplosporangium sp. Z 767]
MCDHGQELPNFVTSLELNSRGFGSIVPDSVLHAYLCASPHLAHLKAPKCNLLHQYLDLHQRDNLINDAILSQSQPASSVHFCSTRLIPAGLVCHPGVWACRNLKTLHCKFRMYAPNDSQPTHVHSRSIFGYFSRICPKLQDLQIHASTLNVSLKGGLCLLTGLSHLEWLSIGIKTSYKDIKTVDLSWMATTRSSGVSWNIQKQQLVTASWKDLLKEEDSIEREWNLTLPPQPALTDIPTTQPSGQVYDDGLVHELRNLGRPLDAKLMLDEMDTDKDFQCWPALQGISMYRESDYKDQELERAVDRLFPGKRIPCVHTGY